MTDNAFGFLKRLLGGEQISANQVEDESNKLGYTEGRIAMAAWNRLRLEDFIESVDPHNTSVNTKYKISAKGEAAFKKELANRLQEEDDTMKKMRVDGLQVQLLELSIQTSKSTLETNKSIQELNDATKNSLTIQKWLAVAVAFFSLASVVVATLAYLRPVAPPEPTKTEVGQPKRQPALSVPPKPRTAKDSV